MNMIAIGELRRSGEPIPEDRDTEKGLILYMMHERRNDFDGEGREMLEHIINMIDNNFHRAPMLNPPGRSKFPRAKTLEEHRADYDPCDDINDCEDCEEEEQ